MSTTTLAPAELARALGSRLTPTTEQSRIIAHPLSPLLVVAGAGSGKTATMTQRVLHLVATGAVRPDQILGLTFTRKATGELAERVTAALARLAGSGLIEFDDDAPEPTIATYNSFAGSLVRDHGLLIGVDPDSTLITEARAWQIVTSLIEMRTSALPLESLTSAVTTALVLDGALSDNLLSVEQAAEDLEDLTGLFTRLKEVPRCKTLVGKAPEVMSQWRGMLEVVEEYRAYKRRRSLLDFGEQIALACRIAEEVPGAAATVRAQYPAVLLDEFQDTSVAQTRLLAALFAGSGVTAVGDPNQAIYGWRGASASALDTFHTHFNPAGTAALAAGGDPQEHTPVLPLSTAWRNDLAILKAANAVSTPLRAHNPEPGDCAAEHIPVQSLQPRPRDAGLASGQVLTAFTQDQLTEAQVVADFMAEQWNPDAELAVLCRTRSQFTAIAEALEEKGLPVSVIGLGGMLTVPEVADVRSLITAAADPERGDRLMRLLTGAGIGAADLLALHALAREQVRAPLGQDAETGEETPDAPLLSEALETTLRWDEAGEGRGIAGLSEAGRRIALRLGAALRRVREGLTLPLPEIVGLAEHALDLDIELVARVGNPLGRRGLDAFRATAEQYAADMEAPTLAGFLEWLEAAQERENGMEAPEVEPEPGAVQVLTIHAAKGLEWDAVAVTGMNEEVFPSYSSRAKPDLVLAESGWMTKRSIFPFPLRADAQTLPPFDLGGVEPATLTGTDLKEMWNQYRLALGRHVIAEERRLAYVAMTRARHSLLLTGAHLTGSAAKPRPASRFLAELRRHGLTKDYGPGWVDYDPDSPNPATDRVLTAPWPPTPADGPQAHIWRARRRAARAVDNARRRGAGRQRPGADATTGAAPGTRTGATPSTRGQGAAVDSSSGHYDPKNASDGIRTSGRTSSRAGLGAADGDPLVERWWQEAELLLAENDQNVSRAPQVRMPAHLAATSLDDLRQDRDSFALGLRRPLPPQPRAAGRLGTVFHQAIAQRLSSRGALLTLAEAGIPDTLAPADRARIERWLTTAENLPLLAGLVLHGTEIDREFTIEDTTVRCRIDAVFRTGKDTWLIVDWKTGRTRAPVDQLSVYVHAWATSQGIDPSAVRAAYAYVEDGVVVELSQDSLLPLQVLAQALRAEAPEPAPPPRHDGT